jgi:NhaC family Na+:H+ antiporter
MATAIGASTAITAGAVISGAHFGDKMTPLSETTILTPNILGSDVYTHIRSMSKATIPAYVIALVIFFLIGILKEAGAPPVDTEVALQTLGSTYNIGVWNLLPIFVLLLLGIKKFPAFLSILIGTLAGALVAVVLQPEVVTAIAADPSLGYPFAALKAVWVAMGNGFALSSGVAEIDKLFGGRGMSSILTTVWLSLGAMSFGAMMDYGSFNTRLITPIISRVKSAGGTIATVMATSLGLHIIGGDRCIAMVLPAQMFMVQFRQRGIHPETLATAAENPGTVTSPLIPWNCCGTNMSAALGVSTFVYLPYCFFNLLNFLLGLIYGFSGINVMCLEPDKQPPLEDLPQAPLVDLSKQRGKK